MFRFIVGMSLFVSLSSVAIAGPGRYSTRIDADVLRQQEKVAAAARAFRGAVYTRYRTDRQAFDRYWAVGEQTWLAWERADYPVSHAEALIGWFESAAAIAGSSRFGALPPTPQLPGAAAASTPFRSVATPQGAVQAPAQPAGEVVFPTTPQLPRQAADAPSQTRTSNESSRTTPQFLTNPTLIDPDADHDANTNPFEAPDAESASAPPKNTGWLRQWKQTLFAPAAAKSQITVGAALVPQATTLKPASGSPQRKVYQEPTLCTEYPALARAIGKAMEPSSKAEREKTASRLKQLGK